MWRRPGSTDWSRWTAPATSGWHEGDGADPRTVSVLEASGYDCDHTARQFRASWFAWLDLVIALDTGHLEALRRLAPTSADAEKVRLLRSYARPSPDHVPGASNAPSDSAGHDLDVPDPYYGGMDGFEECLEMVEAASVGLLAAVQEQVEGRAA